MNQRLVGRHAAATAVALFLAGCGASHLRQPAAEPQHAAGRRQAGMVGGKEFSLLREPEMATLIGQVGDRVRRAAGAPENAYRYSVVVKPDLTAAVSPAGEVFLCTGLLLRLSNRTELAGVLAHEMAHHQAGHPDRIMREETPGAASSRERAADPESLQALAGELALAESCQSRYSRAFEEEADHLAVQYLQKAGYDQQGLLGVLLEIERSSPVTAAPAAAERSNHRQVEVRSAWLERRLNVPHGGGWRPAGDAPWDRARAFTRARAEAPEAAVLKYAARSASGLPGDRDLLAVVLLETGDYRQAEEDLRIAINGDPGNALFQSDLGRALFHLERFDDAQKILERGLSLPGGGEYSRTHFYLAQLQRRRGDAAATLASLRLAAQSQPQLPEAHAELAAALRESGQDGEAAYHFGMAAVLEGRFAEARRSFDSARAEFGADSAWQQRIAAEMAKMR